MKAIEINNQWYLAIDDNTKVSGFRIIAGPYAEHHWLISAHRLNEID